jgi:hypothetical protein
MTKKEFDKIANDALATVIGKHLPCVISLVPLLELVEAMRGDIVFGDVKANPACFGTFTTIKDCSCTLKGKDWRKCDPYTSKECEKATIKVLTVGTPCKGTFDSLKDGCFTCGEKQECVKLTNAKLDEAKYGKCDDVALNNDTKPSCYGRFSKRYFKDRQCGTCKNVKYCADETGENCKPECFGEYLCFSETECAYKSKCKEIDAGKTY